MLVSKTVLFLQVENEPEESLKNPAKKRELSNETNENCDNEDSDVSFITLTFIKCLMILLLILLLLAKCYCLTKFNAFILITSFYINILKLNAQKLL